MQTLCVDVCERVCKVNFHINSVTCYVVCLGLSHASYAKIECVRQTNSQTVYFGVHEDCIDPLVPVGSLGSTSSTSLNQVLKFNLSLFPFM